MGVRLMEEEKTVLGFLFVRDMELGFGLIPRGQAVTSCVVMEIWGLNQVVAGSGCCHSIVQIW